MPYEIATLSGALLKLADLESAARDWIAAAPVGTLLGSWRTEIGPLGRILLLRDFETPEALAEERRRTVLDRNPFNGKSLVDRLDVQSYERFPFLPAVVPREMGGVYEFRTYVLKPGGLPPTLEGWKAAITPAKAYTDHLVVNMYALDGRPRITHIWGFESLEQRAKLREHHYAAGLWPPKGAPEQIERATSTIALSNKNSPLY